MRRGALGASATIVLAAIHVEARANGADCDLIEWSVQREQNWFASPILPHRESGARLHKINRAVQLQLKPIADVQLFLRPTAPPQDGSYAGNVAFFGVPKPGAYIVTLSQPGHIDVFENGMRIKPEVTESAPDCANVAVSARYTLQRGDLVLLQVTNVASDAIKIAFAMAP
jgi:hypothetical protein